MKRFQDVARQVADDLQLPAGLEQLGFNDTSGKPVIERDLDRGCFVRESIGGLPQVVLELVRVDEGYTVALSSIPPQELYKYQTADPVQRDGVVELVTDYLKNVESGRQFQ